MIYNFESGGSFPNKILVAAFSFFRYGEGNSKEVNGLNITFWSDIQITCSGSGRGPRNLTTMAGGEGRGAWDDRGLTDSWVEF